MTSTAESSTKASKVTRGGVDDGAERRVRDKTGKVIIVAERAAEDGRKGLPDENATEPGAFEELIRTQWMQELISKSETDNRELQGMDERFSNDEQIASPQDVDRAIQQALREIPKKIQDESDRLRRSRELENDGWTTRDRFRRDNSIRHAASYHESRLHHYALVFVVILIESVANMYFFAQGNSLGLLGGFIQAILLAFVNVGVAVFMGHFALRALHHRHIGFKVGGTFALIGYLLFLFGFSLVVGHYRDILAIRPDDALGQALPSTIAAPLLISFDSLMLMITSFLAAALGLLKGYTYDDRYPGYGKLERDYRILRANYDNAKADLRRQVRAIPEALEADLQGMRIKARQQIDALEGLIAESEKLRESYEAERQRYEGNYCQWLKEYRTVNWDIRRGTTGRPKYFDDYPGFSSSLKEDIIDGFPARLQLAEAAQQKLVDKLNTPDLTTLVHEEMEQKLKAFLDSIQQGEAERGMGYLESNESEKSGHGE